MDKRVKKDEILKFVNISSGVVTQDVWRHLHDNGFSFNTPTKKRQLISVAGMLSDLYKDHKIGAVRNPNGKGYIWKKRTDTD